ncbi:hypothetical protein Bca101_058342 [Brassica carinata]
MERGGSNLSDKGLNLSGSWQQGHSATTIPVGVFKSSAKDSTALGGNNNSRRSSGASARADLASDTCLWGEAPTEVGNRAAGTCISVLVELILGHLRYGLTDVPPQPNSPPDNVLRRIDPRASLGSKRRGCYPLPVHGVKTPESCSQSVPGRHAACRARRVSSSSSPPTVGGFGTGIFEPSPQSQSFSEVTDPFCPTSLAYIVPSTRGCSPWRPDAVMSTTGRELHSVLRIFKGRRECTDTTRRAVVFQPLDPTSG